MNGENLLIWDGEQHQPINYELYKFLCNSKGYEVKTGLYNIKARNNELFK